jgi:hypothetical protein
MFILVLVQLFVTSRGHTVRHAISDVNYDLFPAVAMNDDDDKSSNEV